MMLRMENLQMLEANMEFVSDTIVLHFVWAFQIAAIQKNATKKKAKELLKINQKLSQVTINGTVYSTVIKAQTTLLLQPSCIDRMQCYSQEQSIEITYNHSVTTVWHTLMCLC